MTYYTYEGRVWTRVEKPELDSGSVGQQKKSGRVARVPKYMYVLVLNSH